MPAPTTTADLATWLIVPPGHRAWRTARLFRRRRPPTAPFYNLCRLTMVYAILQSMKTRDRMLTSTISLLRERGSNGVTVDAVLAHSGAPRGSVYHHFPGGREELLLASVERAGEIVSGVLEQSLSAGDTASAIDRFVSMWKKWLRDSDFRAGCPVLATAIDTSEAPLQDAVRKIFQRWHDDLLRQLVAEGCPGPRPAGWPR